MSKEYLIECSRNKGIEKNDPNNNQWSNIVSNGLILNPNDQVQMTSAYINSIGVAEPDSVFLGGRKSGDKIYKNKYNVDTKKFDKTIIYEQFDNKLRLLNSYYKNGDGNFCFFNPPTFWGQSLANYRIVGDILINPDSDIDSVLRPIQTTDFWDLDEADNPIFNSDNIIPEYIEKFKNERYTIFKRDEEINSSTNDFQDMVYYPYETEININLPAGYNNKSYISSEITRQLNNIVNDVQTCHKPVRKETEALGFRSPPLETDYLDLLDGFDNLPSSMYKETQVFKAIPCGTEQSLSRKSYSTFRQDTYIDLYKENFQYLGVLYPSTFMAFRQFMYYPKKEIDETWVAQWGYQIGDTVSNITIYEDIAAPVINTKVKISLPYSDYNNTELYKVFQAELFDYTVLTDFNLDPNTERFIHIQGSESALYTGFGSDFKFNFLCQILKIHLIQNLYGVRGDGSNNNPDYGFVYKSIDGYIELKMTTPDIKQISYPLNDGSRCVGFSRAATSWGNNSITLWNGYNEEEASNKKANYKIEFGGVNYYTSPTIKRMYIGADQIIFGYSQGENRYEISQCHNAKKLGNDLRVFETDFGVELNAGNPIYKINPYDTETNNPVVVPNSVSDLLVINQSTIGQTRPFFSLERYKIFDAYGGIFWDFSIDESFYNKSLWYILGFSKETIFDQSPTRSTRQLINTFGQLSYPLTTNALVESDDLVEFSVNPQSYSTFVGQLPVIQFSSEVDQPPTNRPQNLTQIIVNQVSSSIGAKLITINNQEGVYLVRSNIIPNQNYLDGEYNNIVGIIDKSYLVNDFIYSKGSDIIFTITKKCIINHIKIDIKNADGSDAILDENSLIIFKIIKN